MLGRPEKFKRLEERRDRIKFSIPMKPNELEDAYSRGMLRKSELKDGAYYRGYCRHATVAMWSAEKNCFLYMRQKFDQHYSDKSNHPEDDNGFDLFVPLEKTTPTVDEIICEEDRRKSV